MSADVEETAIKTGLTGNEDEQFQAICRAYERYADPLAGYILEKVAPTIDGHDLTAAVNKVFVELAEKAKRGNFRRDGSLRSLLFRMARCNAIDAMRAAQKYYERHVPLRFVSADRRVGWDGGTEEDVAARVAKRLSDAPEVAATWKALTRTRNAADETLAKEAVRQFKLLIPRLPRLQRKVAEIIAFHFGDVTNEEICDEIARTGERPPVSSVKSAREQIRMKFEEVLRTQERMVQS